MLLDVDLSRKQRGIEHALRAAIRGGRLRPGDTLSSTRALAAELGVARATVLAAYEQLAAEGYLVAEPGGRTRVAAGNWSAPPVPAAPVPQPSWCIDLIPGEGDRSAFRVPPGDDPSARCWPPAAMTCSATATRSDSPPSATS
ncbi:MAG: GntR family transcriptional regulator [Acidimicrobiia bacterium]